MTTKMESIKTGIGTGVKILAIIEVFLLVVVVLWHVLTPWRIVYNGSPSTKVGWYWVVKSSKPPTVGSLVLVRSPALAQALGCVHGREGLLKYVVGVPKDTICIKNRELYIPDQTIPYSIAPKFDSKGRSLDLHFEGCIQLKEDQYFLATPHPLSCDSRLLGPFDKDAIIGHAKHL